LQWTLSYANRCMNRNSPRTGWIRGRSLENPTG